MQKIILFNGPPSCGKDTAALSIFHSPSLRLGYIAFDRMSMPIKRAFAATIGRNIDWKGNTEHYEKYKELTIDEFGVSYRQWQIDFSEKFMKPLYGDDIFTRLFISRSKRQHPNAIIVVPDCGFDIEYTTLLAHFGKENVLLVKIWRDGTSFANDSRSYLKAGGSMGDNPDIISQNVLHLANNGAKDEFETKVVAKVKEWLNHA